MMILIYLVPLALLIMLIGIYGVFWSVRNNQFDDIEGEASRILMAEDEYVDDQKDRP